MFIVVSNDGDWEHDMLGVIGTIEKVKDLPGFIKHRTKNNKYLPPLLFFVAER